MFSAGSVYAEMHKAFASSLCDEHEDRKVEFPRFSSTPQHKEMFSEKFMQGHLRSDTRHIALVRKSPIEEKRMYKHSKESDLFLNPCEPMEIQHGLEKSRDAAKEKAAAIEPLRRGNLVLPAVDTAMEEEQCLTKDMLNSKPFFFPIEPREYLIEDEYMNPHAKECLHIGPESNQYTEWDGSSNVIQLRESALRSITSYLQSVMQSLQKGEICDDLCDSRLLQYVQSHSVGLMDEAIVRIQTIFFPKFFRGAALENGKSLDNGIMSALTRYARTEDCPYELHVGTCPLRTSTCSFRHRDEPRKLLPRSSTSGTMAKREPCLTQALFGVCTLGGNPDQGHPGNCCSMHSDALDVRRSESVLRWQLHPEVVSSIAEKISGLREKDLALWKRLTTRHFKILQANSSTRLPQQVVSQLLEIFLWPKEHVDLGKASNAYIDFVLAYQSMHRGQSSSHS